MISIEIISKGESTLKDTLESIRRQNYEDYEIACAIGSDHPDRLNDLREYGCRIARVPSYATHMQARLMAHKISRGDFVLLLDSTRYLNPSMPDALRALVDASRTHDMLVIREDTAGSGFWIRQAKTHNRASERDFGRISSQPIAFLLPRWYPANLLSTAIGHLESRFGQNLDRVSYGEHQLLFEECWRISKSVGFVSERAIVHYGDRTLRRIARKYFWYGRSQTEFRNLGATYTGSLGLHRRSALSLTERIATLPLVTARTTAFASGYLLASLGLVSSSPAGTPRTARVRR